MCICAIAVSFRAVYDWRSSKTNRPQQPTSTSRGVLTQANAALCSMSVSSVSSKSSLHTGGGGSEDDGNKKKKKKEEEKEVEKEPKKAENENLKSNTTASLKRSHTEVMRDRTNLHGFIWTDEYKFRMIHSTFIVLSVWYFKVCQVCLQGVLCVTVTLNSRPTSVLKTEKSIECYVGGHIVSSIFAWT